MPTEFQSSFIPKTIPGRPQERSGIGFLSLVALFVFLFTVAGAVGLFMYNKWIVQKIDENKTSLSRNREAFKPEFLDAATRLNKRLVVAEDLLKQHVAVTPVFRLLEETTLKSVSFRSFNFTTNSDGLIKINASGITTSYAAVVAQSDYFGRTRYLRDVIFSGLTVDERRNVGFVMNASLDPELIRYANIVGQEEGSN